MTPRMLERRQARKGYFGARLRHFGRRLGHRFGLGLTLPDEFVKSAQVQLKWNKYSILPRSKSNETVKDVMHGEKC